MVIGAEQLDDGTWKAEGWICTGYGATREEAMEDLQREIRKALEEFKRVHGFYPTIL